MQKIVVLPDLVVDQIAAGEVLENPASAVKELIENSIDAGATEIRVEIEGGGLQRIQIEDNGSGMNREDLALCLKRHATSKIRSAEDLGRLVTMGFRGEALAAVSKIELKTSNGKEGSYLAAQGSQSEQITPRPRNRGTTIEARDLFFNTPARLKFQKSAAACAAAVLKTVQTISLAHPEIAFRLLSNGKLTFDVKLSEWKKRAEEVLGPFAHEIAAPSVRGLLGRPEEGKANRSGQVLFVNQRPVFSPWIAKAVKTGFGTRMREELFPVFLLFLEVAPDAVDVNVHPQKKEVRFRDEGKIYALVQNAVIGAFQQSAPALPPVPWDFTPMPTTPFILREQPTPSIEERLPMEPCGRPLVQLGDFLLVEEEGWQLIDLKGASARLLFEEIEAPQAAVQPLIWPLEIDLQESSEEVSELLKAAKIESHPLGPKRLAIDALPSGLEPAQVSAFLQEFQGGKRDRRLAAVVTRTCRASTRAYSFEEACLIWRKLQNCEDKQYDPLGRTLAVSLTKEALKEMFR